jgi:hypothetical protein
LFINEVGKAVPPLRFRGAGFGLAGPRAVASALLTKRSTANLAEVEETTNIRPAANATIEITRIVFDVVFKVDFEAVTTGGFMEELLLG